MMGENYEKLDQVDKAIECYDKALEMLDNTTNKDKHKTYKEHLMKRLKYLRLDNTNITQESEIGDDETKIFEITQFKYVEKHKFVRFTCTNEKMDILFPVRRSRFQKGPRRKRQIIIKWSDIDTIKITKTVEKMYGHKYYTYRFAFIDRGMVIEAFENEALYHFRRKELRKILPRLSAYMKSINKTYIQDFDNKTERFYRNIPQQFYTVVVPALLCSIFLVVIILFLIPK